MNYYKIQITCTIWNQGYPTADLAFAGLYLSYSTNALNYKTSNKENIIIHFSYPRNNYTFCHIISEVCYEYIY